MKRKTLLILALLALMLVLGTLISCGEHEHVWVGHINYDATCYTNGEAVKICSICGESQTEVIPKKEHTFGDWVVIREATCTVAGSRERRCSACLHLETETIETSYQHTWGDWVMVSEPECEKSGIRTHICTSCKQAESEYVDPTGHTFSQEWSYDEWTHWYDTTCGHEGIKASDTYHKYSAWETVKAATCTEEGLQTRHCLTCPYVVEAVIDPLGHLSMTDKLVADYTGHWKKCFSCDYKMEFAPHTYVDGVCLTCGYAPSTQDILILTEKSDGTYRVDGVRIPFSTIEIPAMVDNKVISEIGANAFKDADYLLSLTLSPGITKIGNSAFSGCTGLTSLVLPSTVTDINSSAFSGCTALESINIPVGVTKLPMGIFEGCAALTAIQIPEGVTDIGMWAFSGCTSLAEVTLPTTLTKISGMAFVDCKALTAIHLPEGITEVADGTFEGCVALTQVTLPATLTYIGEDSFRGCTALSEITIPAAVAEIGNGAFYESGLVNAYFEDKVIWELTDSEGNLVGDGFITPTDPEKAAEILRDILCIWKK